MNRPTRPERRSAVEVLQVRQYEARSVRCVKVRHVVEGEFAPCVSIAAACQHAQGKKCASRRLLRGALYGRMAPLAATGSGNVSNIKAMPGGIPGLLPCIHPMHLSRSSVRRPWVKCPHTMFYAVMARGVAPRQPGNSERPRYSAGGKAVNHARWVRRLPLPCYAATQSETAGVGVCCGKRVPPACAFMVERTGSLRKNESPWRRGQNSAGTSTFCPRPNRNI